MKKEKGETEEERKRAEEQIETMRKEHEEKVISFSSFVLLRDHSMFVKGIEHLLKSLSIKVYPTKWP